MRGVFDDEEREPEKPRRDTELTLGSAMLLGIFFGMVLLCGLCFALGFTVGRRGPSQSAAAGQGSAAGAQPSSLVATTKAKPSATVQVAPQPQRAVVSLPPEPSGTAPVSAASPGPSGDGDAYNQPQVRPALAPVPYQPGAQPATAPGVAPAIPPAPAVMVQIAAVSHIEDADVLVGALRKRGYAVSARRLPMDSLIHVQIGPFNSRDEAYRWRQKLLNDGYNAIVEP